ncbi:uncharacterized protein YbjT (DUF2867 family) [Neorhizobium galegae]|uniref:NmrA family NAD(P)-binding protein n=1 Tax=Neorhizobium galegae TaxID=399 RepID=UPI001AE9C311|nr:NmrA family NAD(P)-binding protein [Neorhizobium galegae]MBP2551753.1 uncharacterized protein YbjT (DUF2867 family) [Neorhizobium galegae]
MKIAVVGATGRIGAKLTRMLLSEGHQVRALSRGGSALDELVSLGAEPFIGSFDNGTGELNAFFRDMDAAFLMVKTDWNNIEGHYRAVAQRFVDALKTSDVKHVLSLTSMGSEVEAKTGHFESFHQLETKLNELTSIDLVHLRAAWFMENTFAWIRPIARYGRIGWSCLPDVKMPWVAIDDIAELAARELTHPRGQHRVALEVGSQDVSMHDLVAIIGAEIGKPVAYRVIDIRREEVKTVFLVRFGTPERWQDDVLTADAMNSGLVTFHGQHEGRPHLPTTMEAFIRNVWKPSYHANAAPLEDEPETFALWCAKD